MQHPIKRYNGMPCTRMGWHKHFMKLAEKREGVRKERCLQLATWFYILHLAFDHED